MIDLHLAKTGNKYLIGDECTYADLMFAPYIRSLEVNIDPDLETKGHKLFTEWKERLFERPAVKSVLKQWEEALAAASQGNN